MADWPKFRSHKIVRAAPIVEVVDAPLELHIIVKPYGDHRIERFLPTEPAMSAHAEVGGYAVIYADGFKSVSPKGAFEDGYTRI